MKDFVRIEHTSDSVIEFVNKLNQIGTMTYKAIHRGVKLNVPFFQDFNLPLCQIQHQQALILALTCTMILLDKCQGRPQNQNAGLRFIKTLRVPYSRCEGWVGS